MPDWHWLRRSDRQPPVGSSLPKSSLASALPRLWAWRQLQKSQRTALIGGAITLAVILIGGSLAVIGAATRPASRATPPLSAAAVSATETAVVFQGSATSTAQPAATATPQSTSTSTSRAPLLITGATLGGTQAAFAAAFGPPATPGAPPSYAFTTSGGLSGSVCFCLGWPGTDGQQRLDTLEVVSAGWGYAQCAAVLRTFFPPDAQPVTTITDPFLGPRQVFQSADLSVTFPAAAFTRRSPESGLVPPGTFSVIAQDPAQQTCGMNIGE